MVNKLPTEIFMPPNVLMAKVGRAAGAIDMSAVQRAEAAIDTLKVEFDDWVASDVQRLGACRDRFAAQPDHAAREQLFLVAHDLKGQATTCDYPMIARLSSSLTRLFDGLKPTETVPVGLVDAHVAAIRVVFRDKIRTATDRMSIIVAEELEARVTETIEAARAG